MSTENRVKEKKRYFALGVVIICLAIVGTCFLGSLAVNSIKDIFNNQKAKAEYESYLYPVVMLDPQPFDDVTNGSMEDLLNASILSLLTNDESNPHNFEFVEGETSGLAIEKETVEQAFYLLFGKDVTPVHQSVECSTCVFEYQSAVGRYVIPLTGYDPAYLPRVIDIDKKGEGTVALTVGYVAYGDWQISENQFVQPEPVKYRKITLRENDDSFYISAIQNAEGGK